MKVLFLDTPSFGKLDLIEAWSICGYEVVLFDHENLHEIHNKEFQTAFKDMIANEHFQFVFSINYFPAVSECCQLYHLKYLSFVYDSPLVSLFSYTVINPCNAIFLFDKTMCLRLQKEGISTVYYMPLAANTTRLSSMTLVDAKRAILSSDVSFVGALYNEDHNLFDKLIDLPDMVRGYIDAIMAAQLKVSGYFFIEELLTPDITKELQDVCAYPTQLGGTEPDAYVYANYFIARKLTNIEREHLLRIASENHDFKLYTHNPTPHLPCAKNMGAIDYYGLMPHVFKNSKINLNITLRSIQSGIPLRAFDIMGAGGFLLSNYQADFFDFFIPGEDFDYYEDEQDMLHKIDYYLSHEKERSEIAQNAYQKITMQHTYVHRVKEMIEFCG